MDELQKEREEAHQALQAESKQREEAYQQELRAASKPRIAGLMGASFWALFWVLVGSWLVVFLMKNPIGQEFVRTVECRVLVNGKAYLVWLMKTATDPAKATKPPQSRCK